MAKAILTAFFCCLPLGIVAIVFAASVNDKYYSGNLAGARDAARQADKWGNWSIWAGIAGVVLYGIILLIAAVADS
jgi:hypothetical protein